MKNKRPLFYRNTTFFILCLFLFAGMICIDMINTKKDSFLFINNSHNSYFDILFSLTTYMGDGIFIIVLALVLFLLKYKRLAIGIFGSYIVSGIFVQLIKQLIDFPRPAGFLQDPSVIHSVYSMALHHDYSFPSGHTTSAFAAAATISLHTGKRSLALITLIMACGVGYSRIYLGQHFVEDVLGGFIFGLITGTLCYLVQEKLLAKSYAMHDWGKL